MRIRSCVSASKEGARWKGGKRATGGGTWGPRNRWVNSGRLDLARLQYWIMRSLTLVPGEYFGIARANGIRKCSRCIWFCVLQFNTMFTPAQSEIQ